MSYIKNMLTPETDVIKIKTIILSFVFRIRLDTFLSFYCTPYFRKLIDINKYILLYSMYVIVKKVFSVD